MVQDGQSENPRRLITEIDTLLDEVAAFVRRLPTCENCAGRGYDLRYVST